MALLTTGLKKRKKLKKASSVSKIPAPPKSKLKKPPKYWTGQPVGPGKPPTKRPKPIGPGKPPRKKPGPPPKKPGKPPQYSPGLPKPRPPGKTPVDPPKKGGGFGGYVKKYPDLAAAYKKHKKAGGKSSAAAWGKSHYEKHGKKEKRKLS